MKCSGELGIHVSRCKIRMKDARRSQDLQVLYRTFGGHNGGPCTSKPSRLSVQLADLISAVNMTHGATVVQHSHTVCQWERRTRRLRSPLFGTVKQKTWRCVVSPIAATLLVRHSAMEMSYVHYEVMVIHGRRGPDGGGCESLRAE